MVAAIDNDEILSSSYEENFPDTNLLVADLSKTSGLDLERVAQGSIDGLIGGPPCQAFSGIGKRDPNDPRRLLVGHFYRLVAELQPKFFVMENVPGLNFPKSAGILADAMRLLHGCYSILGPETWNAAEFGAATNRHRIFVIGIHRNLGVEIRKRDIESFKKSPATVRAAISDLTDVTRLEDDNGFDSWKITKRGRPREYARNLRSQNGQITGHRFTQHSECVVARFDQIKPGEIDLVGRHPRLSWTGQCPTLRAGTGSDKGSFQSVRPIHPDLPRVITVREAARLQGFPDNHKFHKTIWHSFRMIGNSVSPPMAQAILDALSRRLLQYSPIS